MIAVYIIGAVIIGIILIVYLIGSLIHRSRKKEYSDWQVGDEIALNGRKSTVRVLGWTTESLYIKRKETDGTYTVKIMWDTFNYNKSAMWRRNYNEAKEAMGKEPGFNGSLGKGDSGATIDGKSIELLTETECEVYLKQCVANDEFELAALIRKRMEKFR